MNRSRPLLPTLPPPSEFLKWWLVDTLRIPHVAAAVALVSGREAEDAAECMVSAARSPTASLVRLHWPAIPPSDATGVHRLFASKRRDLERVAELLKRWKFCAGVADGLKRSPQESTRHMVRLMFGAVTTIEWKAHDANPWILYRHVVKFCRGDFERAWAVFPRGGGDKSETRFSVAVAVLTKEGSEEVSTELVRGEMSKLGVDWLDDFLADLYDGSGGAWRDHEYLYQEEHELHPERECYTDAQERLYDAFKTGFPKREFDVYDMLRPGGIVCVGPKMKFRLTHDMERYGAQCLAVYAASHISSRPSSSSAS